LTNPHKNQDRYGVDIIASLNGHNVTIEVKHKSFFFGVNEFSTGEPDYFAVVDRETRDVHFYPNNEFKKEWIPVGKDNYTHRTIYVNKKNVPLSSETKRRIEGTCKHNMGINWFNIGEDN